MIRKIYFQQGVYGNVEDTTIKLIEDNVKKYLHCLRIECCCCCLTAKSRPTPGDHMDCSPPGSSVHGISQARIQEWVAISSSRESC